MYYKVSYHSMTATYGPAIIQADSPEQAKRKFACGAFSSSEMCLITAREISDKEILDSLRKNEERE